MGHVDEVDDLRSVGADRLDHNVVQLVAGHVLGRVVLYDVEQFLAVAAARLVRVRLFAQLAFQVLPKVSNDVVCDFHYSFARKPCS